MSDIVRDRVLDEALPEIPLSGFSQATLDAAATKAGIANRELQDAFPKGPASLVEAFSHWADKRMAESLAAAPPGPRIRDRVTSAVKARIELLAPHRQAARRAAAFLAAPQNAPLAARLMMKSVDAMWRAAGDSSSDFSYYTKRAMLAGVYGASFAYWLSDSSEGNSATWTFLDNRIDNVMQFEKLKGRAKDAFAKLPDPLGILNALRGSSRR
jgi:ubiquinone biosynthesis protein COQ9